MTRRADAVKVGAAVAACAVCCPALVLVPLGLLSGVGASATTATAVLGAPVWLVGILLMLTVAATTGWVRRLVRRRRAVHPTVVPTSAARPELLPD